MSKGKACKKFNLLQSMNQCTILQRKTWSFKKSHQINLIVRYFKILARSDILRWFSSWSQSACNPISINLNHFIMDCITTGACKQIFIYYSMVASWSLANAQANESVNFFIFPDWLMDQCRKIIGWRKNIALPAPYSHASRELSTGYTHLREPSRFSTRSGHNMGLLEPRHLWKP